MFLTVTQVGDLLNWTNRQVLAALQSGQLVGIKTKGSAHRGEKWAIVHPGEQFVDYMKNWRNRCKYIPLLGTKEVCAILGLTPKGVSDLVLRKRLKPALIRPMRRGVTTKAYLFAPEDIRQFIAQREKKDPSQRTRPALETLLAWYCAVTEPHYESPVEEVEEHLQYLHTLPEPRRAFQRGEILKDMDEVRKRLEQENATVVKVDR